MAAYFGYMLLAGAQAPFFYNRDKLGQRQFNTRAYLLLCCIEIILLAGLRGYTVGADTVVYLNALRHYNSLPIWELPMASLVFPFDFEIGYFALTKICAFFGMNETAFLFVIAMLTYIPLFSVIKKYSSVPYLSILSYFAFGMFSYSLGVFRQMIAISILLCGWKYIRERRPINYFLVVALAMTFHTTAIIGALLYVLYGLNWRKIIWLVIPAELFLIVFGRQIAMLAFRFLPKYAGYIGGQYDQQGGSYLMLLMLNAVLFACIILDKMGRYHDNMTISALIIAVLLQSVGYSMAIFGRIVPYFSVYLIFAIPDAVYGMGKNWRKPAGVVAVAVLFFLTYRLMAGNQYVTPYYFFFQNIPIK